MQDRTGQMFEDLLMDTLDAVSRFRVGQREAVGGALDAGGLLSTAKGRLQHGEWGNWLERVGLNSRTASRWMKLAGMELTAEQIIAQGGIRAVLSGKPRAAKKDTVVGNQQNWDRCRGESQGYFGGVVSSLRALL